MAQMTTSTSNLRHTVTPGSSGLLETTLRIARNARAGMAELVDALDSKSSEGNLMRVRVSLPAPEFHTNFTERTCVCTSLCMLLAYAGCPCATCLPATHRQARRECRRRQDPETTHVGDLCVLCASAFSRSPVPDAIYLGTRSCVALPRQLLPAVVCPWSRALRARWWNIGVRLRLVTPLTERPPITDLESCAPARERSRHVPPQ